MPKASNHKILLTGGHAATTAIATVEEILKRKRHVWDIYWVGSGKAIEGSKIPTLESISLPKLGVKVRSIITGRLQRKFTIWTIPSLIKMPIGFIHAFLIINKIKPNIVISFGGYAALPIVVIGKVMKIPIVLHEQTMTVGKANKISAFFADRIALARGESMNYLPN